MIIISVQCTILKKPYIATIIAKILFMCQIDTKVLIYWIYTHKRKSIKWPPRPAAEAQRVTVLDWVVQHVSPDIRIAPKQPERVVARKLPRNGGIHTGGHKTALSQNC